MSKTFTYEELYPVFNPATDGYQMPGELLIGEEHHVSVLAFQMGHAAMQAKGTRCPCCGQHAQIYRRMIYKKMARGLYWLVREFKRRIEMEGNDDYINLKDISTDRGGDTAKLVYWSLMVKDPTRDSYYKPTQLADDYVNGRIALPKYAYVYNGQVLGYSSERQSFQEAAGRDFDKQDIGVPR